MTELSWIRERNERRSVHATATAIAADIHQGLSAHHPDVEQVRVYLWHGDAGHHHKMLSRTVWILTAGPDSFPAQLLDVVRDGGLVLISTALQEAAPLRVWRYEPAVGVWALNARQARQLIRLAPSYLDAFILPSCPHWDPQLPEEEGLSIEESEEIEEEPRSAGLGDSTKPS